MPRIGIVFYSTRKTYRFGFGQIRFPGKVLGINGWRWSKLVVLGREKWMSCPEKC